MSETLRCGSQIGERSKRSFPRVVDGLDIVYVCPTCPCYLLAKSSANALLPGVTLFFKVFVRRVIIEPLPGAKSEPADSSWRSCHTYLSSGLPVSTRLCRKSLRLSGSWALLWLPAAEQKCLAREGCWAPFDALWLGWLAYHQHEAMVVFRFASELGLIGLQACLELFMICWDGDFSWCENGSSYDSTPFAKHIVSLFS